MSPEHRAMVDAVKPIKEIKMFGKTFGVYRGEDLPDVVAYTIAYWNEVYSFDPRKRRVKDNDWESVKCESCGVEMREAELRETDSGTVVMTCVNCEHSHHVRRKDQKTWVNA